MIKKGHLIVIVLVLVVIVGLWFSGGKKQSNDIYELPKQERNDLLFVGNKEGEYEGVIKFTDHGIQDHRELIENDVDFWSHRGFALVKSGDSQGALASFRHVLELDPTNELANAFISQTASDSK